MAIIHEAHLGIVSVCLEGGRISGDQFNNFDEVTLSVLDLRVQETQVDQPQSAEQ